MFRFAISSRERQRAVRADVRAADDALLADLAATDRTGFLVALQALSRLR